jgi:gliding motility-associated-like protein
MKLLNLSLLIITFAIGAKAQITTTNTLTPQQLVQQVLLGTGVTANNITFSGTLTAIAQFTASASTNIGIPSGVIMSTGNASGVSGASTGSASKDFNLPGDADLSSIIPDTHDACVLEFDFVPMGDTLSFNYVFASDEYPNYVCSSYADVFGYLVSGPNPAGGLYNKINIATIPGSALPVSINSINSGNPGAGYQASNCISTAYSNLYVSNQNPTNTLVKYNGMSKVLRAKLPVICGQTYHIKMGIADVSDGTLDSGVLLQQGSFSSAPALSLNTNNASALIQDTLFYEDCNTYCITFNRSQNIAARDSFLLNVTGNAINGSDYGILTGTTTSNVVWPTNLVFPAGSPTVSICSIKVIDDGIAEGLDTLVFNISKYNPSASSCIQTNSVKFNIHLSDYSSVNIAARDSNICNSQAITINTQSSLGKPPYTYSWSPGSSSTGSITTSSITETTIFTITVNDICNHPVSKQISVIPSVLPKLSSINDYQFCLDTIKQIPISVTGGELPNTISWYAPTGGITPFNVSNGIYSIQQSLTPSSGTYSIVATDNCNLTDLVTFNIKTYDCFIYVPNVVTANGDGVNDVFKINALENFPDNKLVVFNRWGKQVHSVSSYKNDWKPENSPGTYFYVLELGDGRKYNGFFQLIKD